MIYFLFGAAILLAALMALRWFATTEPRNVVRALALFAAVALIVLSVALVVTGRFVVSLPFFLGALVAWRRYKMARGMFSAAADWYDRRTGGPGTGKSADNSMSSEEAYEVLGLEPGADKDAIRKAHHDLIQKLHPDHGGSTYLSSRINQAKDVLLKG